VLCQIFLLRALNDTAPIKAAHIVKTAANELKSRRGPTTTTATTTNIGELAQVESFNLPPIVPYGNSGRSLADPKTERRPRRMRPVPVFIFERRPPVRSPKNVPQLWDMQRESTCCGVLRGFSYRD